MIIKRYYFNLLPVILITFLVASCSSVSTEKSSQGFVDHGLLKVDDNSRYFVFEDGTPFVPVGLNHFLIYRKGAAIDSMMRPGRTMG